MRVQIWPADGYSGLITEQNSVPTQIGGRRGIVEADGNNAAVQVQPGMLVVFNLSGPVGQFPTSPKASLTDILETVWWAPNPGNEQTRASHRQLGETELTQETGPLSNT